MKPQKTSNLVDVKNGKDDYLTALEWDLRKLYNQFKTFISFNSVSIGDNTNYCYIDSSGTVTLTGSATTWDDLVMPLTSSRRGANNLPDFDETNVGYLFPRNDATEILYIIMQMPHRWKLGSKIFPHVHWAQGNTANAVFNIDYKWINLAGSTTAGFTTYAISTPMEVLASGTTIHQLSTNTAGITPSDGINKISSIFLIKLYRNDDVYPGDVLTYQFDIHYEIDSLGSNTEFSK
jgi:hypothetical protein